MANALPWSVRGIDPDIREQAVEAAHRSGMSVGQWLNQVLAGNLDEDEPEDEPVSRTRRATRRRPHRAEELNERLDRLGQRGTMTAAYRMSEPDHDESPVLELIENAVRAIERIEKQKSAAGEPAPRGRRAEDAHQQNLADLLRNFEKKLDSLTEAPPAPVASRAAGPAHDQRLDALLAMLERAPMAAPSPMSARDMPVRGFPEEDAAFSRTLQEIETRRRALDGDDSPVRRPAAFTPTQGAAPAQDAALPVDSMRAQLDHLVARIDEMRAEPRPDTSALNERLTALTSRIEEWRGSPQEDIVALRRDLSGLAGAIEGLSPQRLVGAVEDAVQRVATTAFHLQSDALPDRLAAPLERMHEDIRALLREVATSRDSDRLTQEIGNISRRLDQLSAGADPAALSDIARETDAIKTLVGQAMRSQPLDGLARQIETIGRQIENFQRAPLPGDDRQILAAIRGVGDQLGRIDPAATFAGIETRLAAISGIEDKLGEIARGMKKLAKDAQPLPQLETIAERLERIDRALDSSAGKPLAGLDALAGRLELIGSSLDRVAEGQPKGGQDALMGMLERLSARMDEAQNARGDSAALDALQEEIAGLARRMETTGTAPGALDGFERNFSDLFGQIDMARKDMRDVAEIAASRAAEQAVKSVPRDDSGETLAAEGLLLIKRDLNEFKTAQSEAEKRTRGTLETLNTTLETLVARLSDVETHERIVMPPAVKPTETAPPLAARKLAGPSPDASDLLPRKPVAAPPESSDLPLEPGVQPSQMPSDAAPNADPRTNFIAAARRAAQAAAEQSQAALSEERPVKIGARQRASGTPASFITRARKPILLGLAAVVFSLGALKVLSTRNQIPGAALKVPTSQPSIPLPRDTPGLPGKSGAADTDERHAEAPQTTGSAGVPAQPDEKQAIPDTTPENGTPKRTERLSETNANTQTDPLTVGSIGPNGIARPIETGTAALTELVAATSLKGQEKLRDAAISGRPEAIFEIGARLADGRGVARDAKLAARWFEQAAAAGHGPSQYRLGSLYREGKGISKDSALAFQWFDRAAAQGHVLAMHNAAVLLAEGVHGTPDYAGAALWFKRAAEHGVKDSQFNIAILFARGLGVNQDLAESYHWFAIAALQGDPDAAKKRDDIAGRLTKEQLAKAMARVKTFKPNTPNPAANDVGSWERVAKRGA